MLKPCSDSRDLDGFSREIRGFGTEFWGIFFPWSSGLAGWLVGEREERIFWPPFVESGARGFRGPGSETAFREV